MSSTNNLYYDQFLNAAPSKQQSSTFLTSSPTFTSLDDYSFVFDGMALPMFDTELIPQQQKQQSFNLGNSKSNSNLLASPDSYSPESIGLTDFNGSPNFALLTPPLSTATMHSDVMFEGTLNMEIMFPSLSSPEPSSPTPVFGTPVAPVAGLDARAFLLPESKSFTLVEGNDVKNETADGKNALTVPALLNALQQQPTVTQVAPAERPKSKVGRKKKPRPTTAEGIAAENLLKRAKNTEAARKSRLRRLERFESVEAKLSELERVLQICVDTFNANGLSLPTQVAEFLSE